MINLQQNPRLIIENMKVWREQTIILDGGELAGECR